MPFINSTQFGEVVIEGKKYGQVLILGDEVLERNYEKLTELFGTSHRIGEWEQEKLTQGNPDFVIVATGQNGELQVKQDFLEAMKGVKVFIQKTPDAIILYNQKIKEGKKVNALIHTTC